MSCAEMGSCPMAMRGSELDITKSPACTTTVRPNKSAEPLVSHMREVTFSRV
jgi:hypothetical protein